MLSELFAWAFEPLESATRSQEEACKASASRSAKHSAPDAEPEVDLSVEDDYDPRNPELITPASEDEVARLNRELLERQMASLAVASARCCNARQAVLSHYSQVLRDMREQAGGDGTGLADPPALARSGRVRWEHFEQLEIADSCEALRKYSGATSGASTTDDCQDELIEFDDLSERTMVNVPSLEWRSLRPFAQASCSSLNTRVHVALMSRSISSPACALGMLSDEEDDSDVEQDMEMVQSISVQKSEERLSRRPRMATAPGPHTLADEMWDEVREAL